MFQNILAALSISFVLFTATAQAAAPSCKTKAINGFNTSYCIQKPDTPSDTLVVFFHGIYGNEKKWFSDSKFSRLNQTMKSAGLEPWVITISYGGTWVLTETAQTRQLFNQTMDVALPQIISEARPEAFTKKFLIGYSMGGLNASQVLLKRTEMFDKYVLLSPAITPIGPYSPKAEIQDYIRRTGAVPFLISMLIDIGKQNFKDQAEWDLHSPLTVITKQSRQLPPVYISAGPRDEYGFDEGSNAFSLALAPMAAYSVWMPIANGAHTDIDPKSITAFLLQ